VTNSPAENESDGVTDDPSKATADLVHPFPRSVSSPLRIETTAYPTVLMYPFRLEYRAWVHVFEHYSHRLMFVARHILERALVEFFEETEGLPLAYFSAANGARAAKRRPRAWMTVNGSRYLGVGADGDVFRSVAVKIDDRLKVAVVVPAWQESIAVELATWHTVMDQLEAHRKARKEIWP